MALSEANRKSVSSALAANREKPGALLPILHGIQDDIGHIPEDAIPVIAEELNLSRAEVHGVVSFYHHFRKSPPGRHVIQICQAESCQACGSEVLTDHAKHLLSIGFHQTSSNGDFTLEPVYCLGNCACSPAIMIDDDVYGRITPARLEKLIGQYAKEQK